MTFTTVGEMTTTQSLADILTSLTSDVRKDKPSAINIRKYTTINRELGKFKFGDFEECTD